MKPIYQSNEEFVVLADDQSKAPPDQVMVYFVRKTNGVWEVWQHGSRRQDSLKVTEDFLPS